MFVTSPVRDARNSGEYVYLRIFLQIEEAALEHLIHDVTQRAAECRLEVVHSFRAAKRHRQAIDEAIRRYRRMIISIPVGDSDSSIRKRTEQSLVQLLNRLLNLLPSITPTEHNTPSDPADSADFSADPGDWKRSLSEAAELMDQLVQELNPILHQLQQLLREKTAISQRIDVFLNQMAAII